MYGVVNKGWMKISICYSTPCEFKVIKVKHSGQNDITQADVYDWDKAI